MQTEQFLVCYLSRQDCLISMALCSVPAPSLGFDHCSGAAGLCSTLLAGTLWTPLLLFLVVPQLFAYGSAVPRTGRGCATPQ